MKPFVPFCVRLREPLPHMLLGTLLVVCASAAAHSIIDTAPYTTLTKTCPNGKLYHVAAPNSAPLDVVHVFGSAYERGEAQGCLMSSTILDFIDNYLPAYYRSEVYSIPISTLPQWLQDIIVPLLPYAADKAPVVFDLALSYVEETQRPFNEAGANKLYDEMNGIADGTCAQAAAHGRRCNATELAYTIKKTNMLPDLIRMQCSMLGAWGSASTGGSLVQLRSLDAGSLGVNHSYLVVQHPEGDSRPFASLSFPGFVGVITGFSPAVALSEKVNDVAGGPKPVGSYEGRSTSFVIRDMVELSATKEAAHAIALSASRTWGVWLGVGDFASQRMLVIEYSQAAAPATDEYSTPNLTGQPMIDSVVYVDKHPQPSKDDLSMPTALQALRASPGSIDAVAVAALGDQTHSGDVHIAVYDFNLVAPRVLLALGTVDVNGTYSGPGGRYAWAAPYLRFDQKTLWAEPKP